MHVLSTFKNQRVPLLLAFCLALATIAHTTPTAPDTEKTAAQEKAGTQKSAGADGDYVGSETCVTCHQDQERRFKSTVMRL